VDSSATLAGPVRPGWPARLLRRLGAFGVTTAISLAVAVPLTAGGDVDAAYHPRRRVVAWVNAYRADAGLRPLRISLSVHRAAELHSRDQAAMGLMTHTGSDGSDAGQRIRRQGYAWSTWGENVAYGYPTARAVVRAWMNSSGHRANILNASFRHVGVGVQRGANGLLYWTLDFARPG
jgi:uncharacterized protein YkwD